MAIRTGTSSADRLVGTLSADTLTGLGGTDTLIGRAGSDVLDGGSGNDTLNGGRGNDRVTGGGGNDTFLFAATDGQDVITDFGSGDIVRISGYAIAQSVTQVGANVVVTMSAADKITFNNSTVATVSAGLRFDAAQPSPTGSTITGTSAWDVLNGTGGADLIYGLDGHDVINGGGGNDRIQGGLAGDDLTGGAGADVFVYSTLADAPPYGLMYWEHDRILDFQSIDKIDLSGIDANSAIAGNQAFNFAGYSAGTPANHSAGTLYIGNSGGYVWIFGYIDGDTFPDLYIEIMQHQGQAVPTSANLFF